MSLENRSTLIFQSNLGILNAKRPIDDKKFLAIIKHPLALEELKKRYVSLTKSQQDIYELVGQHCAYADKGDYPWGTVKNDKGEIRIVCKCMKKECSMIRSCNPYFKEIDDTKEIPLLVKFEPGHEVIELAEDITGLTHNPGDITAKNIQKELSLYDAAIKQADIIKCKEIVGEISNILPKIEADASQFSQSQFDRFLQTGTVTLITNNKARSYRCSLYLYNEDIMHNYHNTGNDEYSAWIYEILKYSTSGVITKKDFESIFQLKFPSASATVFWNALTSAIDTKDDGIDVEDLLWSLDHNGNLMLHSAPESVQPKVNIYDDIEENIELGSYLFLDSSILTESNVSLDDLNYHRKLYSWLNSSRGYVMQLVFDKLVVGNTVDNKDKRRSCYRISNRKLTGLEITGKKDFVRKCFDFNRDVVDKCRVGDRVKLVKCRVEGVEGITYKAVLEEDENKVLCYSSKDFVAFIKELLKRFVVGEAEVSFDNYPDYFEDIYIDKITTCIGDAKDDIGKTFGDLSIWKGLSINGFAKSIYYRY